MGFDQAKNRYLAFYYNYQESARQRGFLQIIAYLHWHEASAFKTATMVCVSAGQ